ncbi:hypothetical protein CAPTEDRAFT_47572, partial [Capitella teleta]
KGLEYEILKVLAKRFNFKYKTKRVADGKWGSAVPGGGWNGMVGEVHRGEADMAMSGIGISESRSKVVDFTSPHCVEPSAVAIRLYPTKWRYFIEPFGPIVWL